MKRAVLAIILLILLVYLRLERFTCKRRVLDSISDFERFKPPLNVSLLILFYDGSGNALTMLFLSKTAVNRIKLSRLVDIGSCGFRALKRF